MKPSKNQLIATFVGLLGASLFIFGVMYTAMHYLDPHATINVDFFLVPGVLLLVSAPIILKKLIWSVIFTTIGLLFFLWVYSGIFQ